MELEVSPEATVQDVLMAAEAVQAGVPWHGWIDTLQTPDVGVWGRRGSLDQTLRPDDRVEVYRPLTVDPKQARRARFREQGARSAGLFAKRRPGSKSGY